MRTFLHLSVLVCLWLFTGVTLGQDSRSNIGAGDAVSRPEPAQANSARIDFSVPARSDFVNMTGRTAFSYDSRTHVMTAGGNPPSGQVVAPLRTGTETLDVTIEENQGSVAEPDAFQPFYSMIHEQRSVGYAWYVNYSWANFQTLLNNLGGQGFRIENIDTYGRTVFDYAGTWTQDGRGWAYVLNYADLNSFLNVLNNWPNGVTRYRPIDFAINRNGTQMLYGAVAVSDNLGFGWTFNENNASTFISWVNGQYSSSRRIVEIGFYVDVNGNLTCSGISKDASYAQQIAINQTYSSFSSLNTQYTNLGYRLVDFDKYYANGNLYYAGLWNNDGMGYSYELDYTALPTFQTSVNGYINQGFKPIVVDVYDADWVNAVDDERKPNGFTLSQNFPNPFNPSTTIGYELSGRSYVTLKIFDILGAEVATLVQGEKPAGHYEVIWSAGANLPSGVYFYRLTAGDFTSVKKLVLLK